MAKTRKTASKKAAKASSKTSARATRAQVAAPARQRARKAAAKGVNRVVIARRSETADGRPCCEVYPHSRSAKAGDSLVFVAVDTAATLTFRRSPFAKGEVKRQLAEGDVYRAKVTHGKGERFAYSFACADADPCGQTTGPPEIIIEP